MIAGLANDIAGIVLATLLTLTLVATVIGGIAFAFLAGTDTGREMGIRSNNQDTK